MSESKRKCQGGHRCSCHIAHDDLVQALRYFIEADKEEHGSTFCLACAKARAALAKIEGEKK